MQARISEPQMEDTGVELDIFLAGLVVETLRSGNSRSSSGEANWLVEMNV